MIIYDLLKQDHRKTKELIGEIEATTDGAEKTRERLFSQVRDDLKIHTEFENHEFYPAVRKGAGATQLIDEGIKEHEQVEALIKELDRESKTSQEWMSKLKKLEQMVEHHVREEEGEIFKKAREAISDDDARRMGEDYENLKQRKMQKKTA